MQTDQRRSAFAYIAGSIIVLAHFVYFVPSGPCARGGKLLKLPAPPAEIENVDCILAVRGH